MRGRPRALGDDEDMGNLVQQKFRTSIQAVDLKACDLLGNSGVGLEVKSGTQSEGAQLGIAFVPLDNDRIVATAVQLSMSSRVHFIKMR
jgi:hypothetical protein